MMRLNIIKHFYKNMGAVPLIKYLFRLDKKTFLDQSLQLAKYSIQKIKSFFKRGG